MKTTHIKIEGMTCAGCVASTERALQTVAGVRTVKVDLPMGQATVEHDETAQSQALLDAVTDAGFDAQIEKV